MNQPIYRTTILTGLALMAVVLSVSTIRDANAAEMHHGPAGPSPITGLQKNPSVPFRFGRGIKLFREKCSVCHGQWGEGTADKGPPLVHPYYVPSHHGDGAFFQAARSGVSAHHWKFGNMPPVEGIADQDIAQIVEFVRWWQRENGIR